MTSSNSRAHLVAALCALLVSSSTTLAFAGTDEALDYYDQAKQAYSVGEFKQAADLLERAYAEDPDLIYQYNRIRALEANGNHEEALKVLQIYKGPMTRDEAKRFEDIAEIEKGLLKSIEQGGKVPQDKDPIEEPDPGDTTDPGDGVVTPPDPKPTAGPNRKPLAIGLMAGGGVLTVAAVVVSTGAFLPGGINYDPDAPDGISAQDRADARENQIPVVIGLGAAGVGLLTAGTIVLLRQRGGEASASRPLLTPYATPDGAGATVLLRF